MSSLLVSDLGLREGCADTSCRWSISAIFFQSFDLFLSACGSMTILASVQLKAQLKRKVSLCRIAITLEWPLVLKLRNRQNVTSANTSGGRSSAR
jgi:hypothetical protein